MDPKPSDTNTDDKTASLELTEFAGESNALISTHVVRTPGINIGGNTVTQATEHLPEEQRVILRALHTHARDQKLTWQDLKRLTGLGDNFLYQVMTGRYRYPATVKEKNCRACGKKKIQTN
jgi:hypothetical protein